MAIKADIFAAEYPRRGLILVSNRQGMIEPVRDICAPLGKNSISSLQIMHS